MNLLGALRLRGSNPAQKSYTGLTEAPAEGEAVPGARDARPSSVDASDWNRLVNEVARVLCDGALVDRHLHNAVHVVVRAMRASAAPWDTVYAALASSLEPCHSPSEPTPRGMERHPSAAAALVAHMHCWADCARLEEIERGA